ELLGFRLIKVKPKQFVGLDQTLSIRPAGSFCQTLPGLTPRLIFALAGFERAVLDVIQSQQTTLEDKA
ncbi:MAG: hypothetical protein AAF050_11075, partial [Cyanobacteria bacterium J06649_5]